MFQSVIFVEAQGNLTGSAVQQACTTQKTRKAILSTLIWRGT